MRPWRNRRRYRWLLAVLVVALFPLRGAATLPRGDADFQALSAEVVFREPLRYAVIVREGDGARMLRGRGDALLAPEGADYVMVERVDARALTLRRGLHAPRQTIPQGAALPGLPGHVFSDSVLLAHVSYRYRGVSRVRNPEPRLVSLNGSEAIVELETVLGGGGEQLQSAPPAPDAGPLARVRIWRVGDAEYALHRGEVRLLLDHGGQVLSDLRPLLLPAVSLRDGIHFRVRCGATDGVLTRDGFAVTNAKLIARLGLLEGDLVRSVNGIPADGLRGLVQVYREIRRNAALARIDLELERQGKRVLQTYWLR